MTRYFSLLIVWGCTAALVIVPLASFYFLANLPAFEALAKDQIRLPLRWQTVSDSQWYLAWSVTAGYLAIGLAGLYFLRRAFVNFAKGELFNLQNSKHFRAFSILLFVQAVVQPVLMTSLSVIFSWHHPAGQKMLSISLGTNEVRFVAMGMLLWVMSDLLVAGSRLQVENQQFV